MAASFEPLHKILELEQKKGYDNTAVIGGLNRFLQNWAGQVAEAIPDRSLLRRFQKLVAMVRSNIPRVDMRAAFDTLEYLRRGGRIGAAQALLGAALRIHPLITMKNGLVEPAGRARSRARAMDHLYKFATDYKRIEEMAVEEAACPGDADLLTDRLGNLFPRERIYRTKTTPVIGAHTGPGLLLVALMGDK